MKHVAIIGGGFAGLAAGVALAERGVRVTLLESRPRLGGRAYSFRDDATGTVVDNGQHAMMGCYTETLAFLARIGAAAKVFRQANLCVEMRHPQRGSGAIAFPALPSPLHAMAGILGYGLLSRGERLRALVAGTRLMVMHRRRDAALSRRTVAEVLTALGESAHARETFWYPVAIATLNEQPEVAVAGPFAEVLARAFFGSRAASQFVLPNVGLSELYTEDARRFIEERGGAVELKAIVTGLELQDGRVHAVRLRDGRTVAGDAVISAVPPRALGPLLPSALAEDAWLRGVAELPTVPIVSVHLWFDRPVLETDFVGLLGTTTQFAFNRSRLTGEANGSGRQAVSAVVSAGRDVVEWDTAHIADTAVADLRALLPGARAAKLLRVVVVKERHATISLTPAVEQRRPPALTAIENFVLAGDWIQTGLPATIESAVVSGNRAAALVAGVLRA